MGAQQSKDELLYEQVSYGNVEGVQALRRDGASLEWMDKEGRTPLILASMRPELLQLVRVLIDLGANVNAYRPGSHAGTPLHHAAKKGLTQTVELLLSHGANPLVMNDDCQTALDLARTRGHWNVVRLIETRICLFSGWLRETHGPTILEAIIRAWVSKKIWAVIVPCYSRNPSRQPKYEMVIYSNLQASQPNYVIQLWKAHIVEPILNQPDPALVIVEKDTKKQYKFLSGNEGDKHQMQLLLNACRGLSQYISHIPAAPPLATMLDTQSTPATSSSAVPQSAPATSSSAVPPEDVELAMAINASIQMAIAEGVPVHEDQPVSGANDNGWGTTSGDATHNGWGPPDETPSKASSEPQLNEPSANPYNGWAEPEVRPSGPVPVVSPSVEVIPPVVALPTAPPLAEEEFYGPVQYPSIDNTPVDLTVPAWADKPGTSEAKEEDSSISGLCVICLDAPAEGACIPCGHVAGCMSCLKEIKEKKWGCPVCRAKIDQVVKLYAV